MTTLFLKPDSRSRSPYRSRHFHYSCHSEDHRRCSRTPRHQVVRRVLRLNTQVPRASNKVTPDIALLKHNTLHLGSRLSCCYSIHSQSHGRLKLHFSKHSVSLRLRVLCVVVCVVPCVPCVVCSVWCGACGLERQTHGRRLACVSCRCGLLSVPCVFCELSACLVFSKVLIIHSNLPTTKNSSRDHLCDTRDLLYHHCVLPLEHHQVSGSWSSSAADEEHCLITSSSPASTKVPRGMAPLCKNRIFSFVRAAANRTAPTQASRTRGPRQPMRHASASRTPASNTPAVFLQATCNKRPCLWPSTGARSRRSCTVQRCKRTTSPSLQARQPFRQRGGKCELVGEPGSHSWLSHRLDDLPIIHPDEE